MTGKEPETFHKLGIGALAGLIAQSCTYPLEVTRRRMQTHGLVDAQAGVKKVASVEKSQAGGWCVGLAAFCLNKLTVTSAICPVAGI